MLFNVGLTLEYEVKFSRGMANRQSVFGVKFVYLINEFKNIIKFISKELIELSEILRRASDAIFRIFLFSIIKK